MNLVTIRRSLFGLLILPSLFLFTGFTTTLQADEGQPVAIRFWPGHGITIETMWNLHVGLRINKNNRAEIRRSPDLEIMDSEQQWKGDGLQTQFHVWKNSEADSYVLDRMPDTVSATWSSLAKSDSLSSNAVTVSKVELQCTSSNNPLVFSKVEVDGVVILDVGHETCSVVLKALEENGDVAKSLANADALLMTNSNGAAESCEKIAKLLTPSVMVIPTSASVDKVGDSEVTKVTHNTLAISKPKAKPAEMKFVSLGEKTWAMSAEVADLFKKKEASCKDSRALFGTLSVNQMNFKPANGTHTPRWNAEHMMGRELGFFSQIYRAVDPSIREMDLNPKQMPKDYEFKHPDWSGMEEAQQMARVEEFTRRFAYLLEGMELDKRAKGSRFWTPRSLLKQMERHYNEHTGNVRKKMELPEWPAK